MKASVRLLTAMLFFFGFEATAQTVPGSCGTITDQSWETAAFRAACYQNPASLKTAAITYVPTVVHVIHNGGPENVADTFVLRLITELNGKFANTGVYHAADGLDMGIQLCLVRKDPMGRPTIGITHDSSTASNMATFYNTTGISDVDSVVKQFNWDSHHYFNIYVVKNAYYNSNGVAGYTYFPASHGTFRDGVVVDLDYVNPADTIFYRYDVIAHETGHYLGLYHTFEGGCVNNNCMTDNDRVCDTPPDNYAAESDPVCVRNSCTTDANDTSVNNPFRSVSRGGIGDQDDDYRNYMDYTHCRAKFTAGQRSRMAATLAVTRHSLFDLLSTECNLPAQSVSTPGSANITVTPNPVKDDMVITTPGSGRYSFKMLNMLGRVVRFETFNGPSFQLSLAQLPPDVYVYVIQDDFGRKNIGKIVKQL